MALTGTFGVTGMYGTEWHFISLHDNSRVELRHPQIKGKPSFSIVQRRKLHRAFRYNSRGFVTN